MLPPRRSEFSLIHWPSFLIGAVLLIVLVLIVAALSLPALMPAPQ